MIPEAEAFRAAWQRLLDTDDPDHWRDVVSDVFSSLMDPLWFPGSHLHDPLPAEAATLRDLWCEVTPFSLAERLRDEMFLADCARGHAYSKAQRAIWLEATPATRQRAWRHALKAQAGRPLVADKRPKPGAQR